MQTIGAVLFVVESRSLADVPMIRRGVHKSVQALEADIRTWIENWNQEHYSKPHVIEKKKSARAASNASG